ncbi:MAG: class I SAM-dependent methyltransferase [Thermodesulfobacteriota bacterium]
MTCTRNCPVCGSENWEPFLGFRTGRALTSDQAIICADLDKSVCRGCGIVANTRRATEAELRRYYSTDYTLGLSETEHLFFGSHGPLPRSQVYFDWISPHLPEHFSSLLEIGCGQGHLLKRLSDRYPGKRLRGIDGSREACGIARKKGLAVDPGMLSPDDGAPPRPKVDVILAVGVLEHVETPAFFVHSISQMLSENGTAILCAPVQDYPGCDLFFCEHIWHFTAFQCAGMLENNGLEVVHLDFHHPVNTGFGLFVCRSAMGKKHPVNPAPQSRAAITNRDVWLRIFDAVNAWLAARTGIRLAVFGCSEIFSLLMAYTALGDHNILACLDENRALWGTGKHGIEVVSPEWLAAGRADAVLLAISPKYHNLVLEKIRPYGIEVFSFIQKEIGA